MQKSEFQKLVYVTRLSNTSTLYFDQVRDWEIKRETLLVQLSDFDNLISLHQKREIGPSPENSRITLVNMIPTIRLTNACEATANGLYSISEIAANFANKASKGDIPSSFNAIRKKCENGELSDLAATLGDLQWYRKIRELRTEWAHYSSIFIAEDKLKQPIICVKSYRRMSDKVEFPDPGFTCTMQEFVVWTRMAIQTIDQFGGYILMNYILKLFDPNYIIVNPVRDKLGFPIVHPDNRFETEKISIREYFRRIGVLFPA